MIPRGLPLAASLLITLAGPAAAQSIVGTVVEEGTAEPVSGAIVSLIDAAGNPRGATLTGPDGGYEIHAPRARRYRLRIERIGYRTVHTERFDVEPGERVVRHDAIPVEAVEISAIEVEVEDRCATRPEAAETLALVWEEARKALETTRLSRTARRYDIVRTERVIDPRTRFVREERVLDERAHGEVPFRTRPAGEIERDGWATLEGEQVRYYGPDVGSLLSDGFLERHCFRLTRRDGGIGLEFEPVGRGSRIEIRGVLWIDRETAWLRSLEFSYVGLPYEKMEALAEGRLEFARLDDGRWIVERWWLRAPEIELQAGEPLVVAIVESMAEVRRR